ncbi:hypothetical protein LCGC14_2078230 [marine sediment metagenome]|uniref:Uncharacterized protein n=1 Tax=marine sediment metagenome TaxID=412755 RepID=A0A0F9F3Q4_9ZZZZ
MRQKVIKKLYAARFPIVGTTTSDSDSLTLIKDTQLSPAAQIEDFIEVWIYIAEQATAIDSTANIDEGGQFSATDTTLTVTSSTPILAGDGIQFGVGVTPSGEICRVTSVDDGTTLTIVRGIQGTTATTHENADNIFIIGPALQESARVTDVAFDGSNSQLTIAPGFSASVVSGTNYELHYHFYPKHIEDKINEILENLRRPIYLPLTLVTDGDMESTGVTDWTAAATTGTAPTLAKSTTTGRVLHGRRALSITANSDATNSFAQSASIDVSENRSVFVAADVYITTGDKAKITLRDVTNGADIETAESVATGFVHFEFTAVVPADCEDIQVWLESPVASDVTYWSSVQLLFTNRQVYDYPSALEWSEDFDKIFYYPHGPGLTNTGEDLSFEPFGKPAQIWSPADIIRDETAVVPFRIQLKKGTINKPIFVGGNIDYDVLSADTDTTNAPEDIVVNLTFADMLDAWAQEDISDDKFRAAQVKMAKAENVRRLLAPRMMHFWKPRGRVHGTRGR